MRLFPFAAVAAFSFVLVACDSGTTPEPEPDPVVLLPLEVGNRWVMSYTSVEVSGQLTESRTDTIAVQRDTVISGERWYYVGIVNNRQDFGPIRGFLTNRADGLYRRVQLADGSWTAQLFFATQVEPGTTYDLPLQNSSGYADDAEMTLLATDDPFEVPGVGSVPSYHFRQTFTSVQFGGYPEPIQVPGLTNDFRFSPELGLLQQQNLYLSVQQDGSIGMRGRLNWHLGVRPNV